MNTSNKQSEDNETCKFSSVSSQIPNTKFKHHFFKITKWESKRRKITQMWRQYVLSFFRNLMYVKLQLGYTSFSEITVIMFLNLLELKYMLVEI